MAAVNFSWFVLAFFLLIVLIGVVEAWVNVKPVTGPDYDGDYALPPGTGRYIMGKRMHNTINLNRHWDLRLDIHLF